MENSGPTQPPPELLNIVTSMRDIYLGLLDSSMGMRSTTGACFYACALLKPALEKFYGCETVVRGGGGELDGGYLDEYGVARGHYWLEATRDGQTWVIDITADQFGAPGIVVMSLEEAALTYHPGDQHLVDCHVAEEALFQSAN